MDFQALKLELVQQLVATNDATVLTKVKWLLELLRIKQPGGRDVHEEELIAAATIFGQAAYGEDEPDSSGLVLKEPEPIPVLRAEVKRLCGPACRQAGEVRDTQVLNSVLAFLRGDQNDLLWRSVMSARAERAEADFAAGRVYTQEQVEAHFKAKRAVRVAFAR
ncbi:MAG: hypothetical protein ACK46G_07620 [Flavobacteriales bacterium]